MHTTSLPRRRSNADSKPIKRIELKVTVRPAERRELERIAAARGIAFKRDGDSLSFSIVADTPEEALAKLKLLGALFSPKA